MKHIIIILFLFSIEIFTVFSQSEFRRGYVIKNNNDTIFGLIDYKGNKASSKNCAFKIDSDSEKVKFNPEDIKAYRFINGKYYVSKLINTGESENLIFLEYLINGIVSIYYYRDNFGEHYLLDKGDGKFIKLNNEEKEIIIDNFRYVRDSKKYIGELKYAFRDCPSIMKETENVSLDHKSLINITKEYHNQVCKDKECIVYEKNLPKIKYVIGPLVGINVYNISTTNNFSNDLDYLRNSNFGTIIFPTVGFFFKVNIPELDERLHFQYEGTYSPINLKTKNTYKKFSDAQMYSINDITLKRNAFNNSVMIRYEFPVGRLRLSYQLGGFLNYYFNDVYSRNLEEKFVWGNTYYKEQTNDNPFSKFDYGLSVGFGIFKNIIFNREMYLDLKYQRGFGIIENFYSNNFILDLSIQIGK